MIQVNITNVRTSQVGWSGQFPDQSSADAWIAQEEANGSWGRNQRQVWSDDPAIARENISSAIASNVVTVSQAVSAVAALYSGEPTGATSAIVLTANTPGSNGNVQLVFDGTSSINAILAAWNAANPSNQISLTTGDGTQVCSGSLVLSFGDDAQAAVTRTQYTFAAEYSIASVDVTAQVALQASIQKGLLCQEFGAKVIAQVYAYNEANLGSGALTSQQFNAMLGDNTIANIERLLSNGSLSTALTLINGYTSTLETYFSSAQVAAIVATITGSGLL